MRFGLRICVMLWGSLFVLTPSAMAQETGRCMSGEAEAYLYTMKTGHPDPVVQRDAGDALNELLVARGARPEGRVAP